MSTVYNKNCILNHMKTLLKKLLIMLHPMHIFLNKSNTEKIPFLCIITPIFDDALIAAKGLIADLQLQDCGDFIHVFISNGPSPKIKKYLQKIEKNDPRFKYIELKKEPEQGILLQKNLSKRKNYVMKNFIARRYLIIDADSAVINTHTVATLLVTHFVTRKDIIVANILHKSGLLPKHPVDIARIDSTNFSFSRRTVATHYYPDTPPKGVSTDHFYKATDYFFFVQIHEKKNTIFIPFLYLYKDKRRYYKTILEKIG